MVDRSQEVSASDSTPAPAPLPIREPGATYPGSSTYRQPAATTRAPQPTGSAR